MTVNKMYKVAILEQFVPDSKLEVGVLVKSRQRYFLIS